MLDQLRKLPLRQLFGIPALLIALTFCVWVAVEHGLFAGLAVLGVVCGAASLGLQLAPARPRLQVAVRNVPDPLRLQLIRSQPARRLDRQAIVQEQADLALATMPEQPKPPLEPGDQLGQVLAKTAVTGIQAALTGTTSGDLSKFEDRVKAYGHKLARWLDQLEKSRVEHLKVFDGELRIQELGHAPADHVHLRLRFPEGFLLARKLARASEPPSRPDFSPGIVLPSLLDSEIPEVEPIHLPGSDKARYSMEGDAPVIDYELGRVNQHDHRDVPTFSLRMPGPGSYQVKWEASATGLGKPARGELTFEFAEPRPGEPITTLAEAEAERERIKQLV